MQVVFREYSTGEAKIRNIRALDFGTLVLGRHSQTKSIDFAVTGVSGVSSATIELADAGNLPVPKYDGGSSSTVAYGLLGVGTGTDPVPPQFLPAFFSGVGASVPVGVNDHGISDYIYLSVNPGVDEGGKGEVTYRVSFDFIDEIVGSSSSSSHGLAPSSSMSSSSTSLGSMSSDAACGVHSEDSGENTYFAKTVEFGLNEDAHISFFVNSGRARFVVSKNFTMLFDSGCVPASGWQSYTFLIPGGGPVLLEVYPDCLNIGEFTPWSAVLECLGYSSSSSSNSSSSSSAEFVAPEVGEFICAGDLHIFTKGQFQYITDASFNVDDNYGTAEIILFTAKNKYTGNEVLVKYSAKLFAPIANTYVLSSFTTTDGVTSNTFTVNPLNTRVLRNGVPMLGSYTYNLGGMFDITVTPRAYKPYSECTRYYPFYLTTMNVGMQPLDPYLASEMGGALFEMWKTVSSNPWGKYELANTPARPNWDGIKYLMNLKQSTGKKRDSYRSDSHTPAELREPVAKGLVSRMLERFNWFTLNDGFWDYSWDPIMIGKCYESSSSSSFSSSSSLSSSSNSSSSSSAAPTPTPTLTPSQSPTVTPTPTTSPVPYCAPSNCSGCPSTLTASVSGSTGTCGSGSPPFGCACSALNGSYTLARTNCGYSGGNGGSGLLTMNCSGGTWTVQLSCYVAGCANFTATSDGSGCPPSSGYTYVSGICTGISISVS